MKQFRKIISIFLSLQLMLVSMGFSLQSHYCMGRLMDSAMFEKAASCMGEYSMELEMDCCEDVEENIETDETSMSKIQVLPKVSYALITTILWVVNDASPASNLQFGESYLHPPPLIRDIPVEVQSFRI